MSNLKIISIEKSPEEMASIWYVRISSADFNEQDRQRFNRRHSMHPSHAEAYARVERSLAFADTHEAHPLFEELMDEVLAETDPTQRDHRWMMSRWIAASTAAVGMFIVAATTFMYASADKAEFAVYDTVVGQRSTYALQDGSTVILNTNSRVEVRFTEDQRELTLLRGQAMFEVEKNKDWPFVVEAGNQRITALGTAFDVMLDDKISTVKVVLVEGRVAVDELTPQSKIRPAQAIPSKRIELTSGEQLIASAAMPRTASLVNLDKATSWRRGQVIFDKEPLAHAVQEINRYSKDKIRLADDDRLRNIQVSGVFKAGKTKSFIYVMESTHRLNAQRTSQTETILVWREK